MKHGAWRIERRTKSREYIGYLRHESGGEASYRRASGQCRSINSGLALEDTLVNPKAEILEISDPKHIEWIDVVKGIGILLVVGSHVYLPSTFAHYVFWFHMPLFFFISGFLYKKPHSYFPFLVRKIQHLIIPYVAFLLLLAVPKYTTWIILRPDQVNFRSLFDLTFTLIYGGYFLQGWFGVFWFITCLFFTQQAYYSLSLIRNEKSLFFVVVMAVSLTLAAVNSAYLEFVKLPLGTNIVLMALPIYWAGHIWFDLSERQRDRTVAIGVFIAIVALAVDSLGLMKLTLDMKYNDFGLPGIGFFIAVSYSVVLVKGGQLISNMAIVSRVLSAVGRESLGIMFLHQFIQAFMRDTLYIQSEAARVICAVGLSLAFCRVCRKSPVLSAVFLGETRNDFAQKISEKLLYGYHQPYYVKE